MDGIFGIGFPELVMIAVIALIVLGPERLPGTIREVAKFIKQVRSIGNDLMSQFGDEFKDLQDLDPRRILNEMTDPTKPDKDDKTKNAKPPTPTAAKSTTPTKNITPVTTTTSKPATTPSPATVKSEAAANTATKDSTPAATVAVVEKQAAIPEKIQPPVVEATVAASSVAVEAKKDGIATKLETPAASKTEVENSIAPPAKPTSSAKSNTPTPDVIDSTLAAPKVTKTSKTKTAKAKALQAPASEDAVNEKPDSESSEVKPKAKRVRKAKPKADESKQTHEETVA